MNTITITYALKWCLDFAPHICFTAKKEAFNIKSGRRIKKCYNGRSVGFWIGRSWWTVDDLRPHLIKIKSKEILPF